MKKITVILNFTKVLSLAFLVVASVSCNGNSGGSKGTSSGADSTSTANNVSRADLPEAISGIALVQVDSVIQNYDMYHDLKAEFEQKAKKMQGEIASKANALQKDYADFQEKYEKGLMTRSQAEELQQTLERRRRELETTGGKMQQDLAEEEGVMLRKINDALLKYINKYNESKKFSLIINNATVLYGVPSMDITQDILTGLNEEYIASKGSTQK